MIAANISGVVRVYSLAVSTSKKYPLMNLRLPILALSVSIALVPSVRADVKLPKILSNHMVLQSGKPAAIWGWADPMEKVSVEIGGKTASTIAGDDGKWALKIELPASTKPLELTVTGKNTLKVEDVLVGEVWICSGQSNMEWSLKQSSTADTDIPAANFPGIRHFRLTKNAINTPQGDVTGEWQVCTPETAGGFTGVGFFFGRELHKELGVAVGLVGTNWGGTPAEAWTSRSALLAEPSLKGMVENADANIASYDPEKAKLNLEKAMADWKLKSEAAKAEGKPIPRQPQLANSPAVSPGTPSNLYNGMIAPILQLSIRGAIWYQGESNVGRAFQYRTLFPTMIRNWRKDFAQGDFPFHFVQIAPYGYARGNPAADLTPCAELWDAQLFTLKTVPHTGMAVTTDIGNIQNIHPTNKVDVGHRLALWALAKDYGKKGVIYSGPIYKSFAVEGSKVRVHFEMGAGLKAHDGKALTHFTVAGEDQKFVSAEAAFDGESLLVSSAEVPKPVAVRFAWREDAEPNFVNGAGLPASPFRTDGFKLVTDK